MSPCLFHIQATVGKTWALTFSTSCCQHWILLHTAQSLSHSNKTTVSSHQACTARCQQVSHRLMAPPLFRNTRANRVLFVRLWTGGSPGWYRNSSATIPCLNLAVFYYSFPAAAFWLVKCNNISVAYMSVYFSCAPTVYHNTDVFIKMHMCSHTKSVCRAIPVKTSVCGQQSYLPLLHASRLLKLACPEEPCSISVCL